MTKDRLEEAIQAINKRCYAGRNTDDQLVRLISIDKKTKGWSFMPRYDDYSLISDYDKLFTYYTTYGKDSEAVERFTDILISKGGEAYKSQLTNKVVSRMNELALIDLRNMVYDARVLQSELETAEKYNVISDELELLNNEIYSLIESIEI